MKCVPHIKQISLDHDNYKFLNSGNSGSSGVIELNLVSFVVDMTLSKTQSLGKYYFEKIKAIGQKIKKKNLQTSSDLTPVKVVVDANGLITLDSLREILLLVSDRSKGAYYDLVKECRAIRRKSLDDPSRYLAALENFEKDLTLEVAATQTSEIFEEIGVTAEEVDNSLMYYLKIVENHTQILEDLVDLRMLHRMERTEAQNLSEKGLEKIFNFLSEFTSDPKILLFFHNLERPGWNMTAIYETYLFDKVWNEFGLEEEEVLQAISVSDAESELLELIESYRRNLAKLSSLVTSHPDNEFFEFKAKTFSNED